VFGLCSVNTPTKSKGLGAGMAADLTYWESAARGIASVSKGYKIIVEKSTVPVKTAEAVEKVLKTCAPADFSFDVLSNPEFLAEARARTLPYYSRVACWRALAYDGAQGAAGGPCRSMAPPFVSIGSVDECVRAFLSVGWG